MHSAPSGELRHQAAVVVSPAGPSLHRQPQSQSIRPAAALPHSVLLTFPHNSWPLLYRPFPLVRRPGIQLQRETLLILSLLTTRK